MFTVQQRKRTYVAKLVEVAEQLAGLGEHEEALDLRALQRLAEALHARARTLTQALTQGLWGTAVCGRAKTVLYWVLYSYSQLYECTNDWTRTCAHYSQSSATSAANQSTHMRSCASANPNAKGIIEQFHVLR